MLVNVLKCITVLVNYCKFAPPPPPPRNIKAPLPPPNTGNASHQVHVVKCTDHKCSKLYFLHFDFELFQNLAASKGVGTSRQKLNVAK